MSNVAAAAAAAATATATAFVTSIFIYPIKSCRGISVPQAPITSTGFRWDRQWIVVNSKGRAYTQRNEPKLALVQPDLPSEAFSEDWKLAEGDDSFLTLRAPGMTELKVPLRKIGQKTDGVSCWEWSGSGIDEGNEASKWFTGYLGKPSRLVRFDTDHETRPVDPVYADGFKVTFSDGYPFMIISQGSMDALNQLLAVPLPVNRFRPNILVEGCEPFAEDLWKELKISKFSFQGVKLCSRCKVPTINQETSVADADQEPTVTLMKFRSDKVLRATKKQQGKVYFGQNVVCKDILSNSNTKGMIIRVGDPVFVEETLSSPADAPV